MTIIIMIQGNLVLALLTHSNLTAYNSLFYPDCIILGVCIITT